MKRERPVRPLSFAGCLICYYIFLTKCHRYEVESETCYYYPEYADECHESPDISELHSYYSKSRDHVKRLDEVGALVAVYESVQAVEEVSALDLVNRFYDERSLNGELSSL